MKKLFLLVFALCNLFFASSSLAQASFISVKTWGQDQIIAVENNNFLTEFSIDNLDTINPVTITEIRITVGTMENGIEVDAVPTHIGDYLKNFNSYASWSSFQFGNLVPGANDHFDNFVRYPGYVIQPGQSAFMNIIADVLNGIHTVDADAFIVSIGVLYQDVNGDTWQSSANSQLFYTVKPFNVQTKGADKVINTVPQYGFLVDTLTITNTALAQITLQSLNMQVLGSFSGQQPELSSMNVVQDGIIIGTFSSVTSNDFISVNLNIAHIVLNPGQTITLELRTNLPPAMQPQDFLFLSVLVTGEMDQWKTLDETFVWSQNIMTHKVDYKLTTGVDEFNNTTVNVFPNPASNWLQIETAEPSMMELYDLTGKEVLSVELTSGSNTVDISRFAKGDYIITIGNHKGKKIVKL